MNKSKCIKRVLNIFIVPFSICTIMTHPFYLLTANICTIMTHPFYLLNVKC